MVSYESMTVSERAELKRHRMKLKGLVGQMRRESGMQKLKETQGVDSKYVVVELDEKP